MLPLSNPETIRRDWYLEFRIKFVVPGMRISQTYFLKIPLVVSQRVTQKPVVKMFVILVVLLKTSMHLKVVFDYAMGRYSSYKM
jgi:hypothetical protein